MLAFFLQHDPFLLTLLWCSTEDAREGRRSSPNRLHARIIIVLPLELHQAFGMILLDRLEAGQLVL